MGIITIFHSQGKTSEVYYNSIPFEIYVLSFFIIGYLAIPVWNLTNLCWGTRAFWRHHGWATTREAAAHMMTGPHVCPMLDMNTEARSGCMVPQGFTSNLDVHSVELWIKSNPLFLTLVLNAHTRVLSLFQLTIAPLSSGVVWAILTSLPWTPLVKYLPHLYYMTCILNF